MYHYLNLKYGTVLDIWIAPSLLTLSKPLHSNKIVFNEHLPSWKCSKVPVYYCDIQQIKYNNFSYNHPQSIQVLKILYDNSVHSWKQTLNRQKI